MLQDLHRIWTKGISLDVFWQIKEHFGLRFFFIVFLMFLMLEVEDAVFGKGVLKSCWYRF